jgi:hypothetical protein
MAPSTRLAWNNKPALREALQTVVIYSDTVPPVVEFATQSQGRPALVRVVSPTREAPCCSSHMVVVGTVVANRRFAYQYQRCTECGFTVRRVVRALPDPELVQQVRARLTTALTRTPRGHSASELCHTETERQHWPTPRVGGRRP